MRNARTGPRRPVRLLSGAAAAAAALLTVAPLAISQPASAQAAFASGVGEFYAARGQRPLWLGQPGAPPELLIQTLAGAQLDGLDPRKYRVGALAKALRNARRGNPRAVQQADRLLSEAFVAYVQDLRRPGDAGIIYVDAELKPRPPSARAILEAAAAAPSLERYVADSGWMHPLYGRLRLGLANRMYRTPAQQAAIRLSLERARELPSAATRHVLVNIPAQRLFMYQDGNAVDFMRVVVGQPKHATPMMAAYIRYTALNPYWNVAPDLVAERTAPNVLKQGVGYLKQKGYQVLTDWGDNATILDPRKVDWKAVAAGKTQLRVRQLPGPANSMGRMKFMFPNEQGIYLHDTPEKEKLEAAARLFSGGCIRLEDAARLGVWLYGRPLRPQGARPEQKVPLEPPVPVYITYLTAMPSGSQLAFYEDIYGRDAARLARPRQLASR